jgi:hypothetical protein
MITLIHKHQWLTFKKRFGFDRKQGNIEGARNPELVECLGIPDVNQHEFLFLLYVLHHSIHSDSTCGKLLRCRCLNMNETSNRATHQQKEHHRFSHHLSSLVNLTGFPKPVRFF